MHATKKSLAAVLSAVALAVAAGATSSAEARDGSRSALAGITVVGWQPERLGTTVWRGGRSTLKNVRFLKGAQQATLMPSAAGVAFARRRGDGLDLFLTGTYAGFEQPLAHLPGARTTAIAFSPDGRSFAFATPKGIETRLIVPAARRRNVPLPARWRGSTYQALAFSPDGRLIAFSRTWGDGRRGTLRNELAVVARDGTDARSLVRNPDPYGAQYRPTFSPDGQRIAFPAADGSLASVAVSGGPAERLTSPTPPGSQRRDADPVYSRSGDWIAFTRAPGRGGSDVFLVRPDGSGLRRLTTTPPPAEPGEPRTGSSALAWSPDGATLLAFRHDHFAVVDVAGGTSTPIARVGVQYGIGPAVWN